MTAPDWLSKRGAQLRPGLSAQTVYVEFAGIPQYRLDVVPAGGQFACAITQAVNARRIDEPTKYPDAAATLAGGLEQLRNKLGW